MNEIEEELPIVLWDLDGTIVDSEDYWIQAEVDLASRFGGVWGHQDGINQVGQGLPVTAAALQACGVNLSIEAIIDELADSVLRHLQTSIPWRPGARELLQDLDAMGCSQGLVTMSVTSIASFVAQSIPGGPFAVMITGDTALEQKPHPAPYLQAAEAFGADPARCLAIEDSPSGCASAFNAGMTVVGVTHLVPLTNETNHFRLSTLAGQSAPDLVAMWHERMVERGL